MRFELDVEAMKQIINVFSKVDDDVILTVQGGKLVFQAIDPAKIYMVIAMTPIELNENLAIAVSAESLKDFLKRAKGFVVVEVDVENGRLQLINEYARLRRQIKIPLSEGSPLPLPRVPVSAIARLESELVKTVIEDARNIGNKVSIKIDELGVAVATKDYNAVIPIDSLINLRVSGPQVGTYRTDYISDFLRPQRKGAIELGLSSEAPLRLRRAIPLTEGEVGLTAYIAPYVE